MVPAFLPRSAGSKISASVAAPVVVAALDLLFGKQISFHNL
jgi:hypothetical protein